MCLVTYFCICLLLAVAFGTQYTERRKVSANSIDHRSGELRDLTKVNCSAVNCVDHATDKRNYTRHRHKGRSKTVSRTKSLFQNSVTPPYKFYTDLAVDEMAYEQVRKLQKAIQFFGEAVADFEGFTNANSLNLLSSLSTLYEHLCSRTNMAHTYKQIKAIRDTTTGESLSQDVSLVKTFHESLPKATNDSSTGCYRTVDFVQRTTEVIPHVIAILQHIHESPLVNENEEWKTTITDLISHFRKLQVQQWRHVQALCTETPCYGVAKWIDMKPCATHFSFHQKHCRMSPAIHLYTFHGKLHIGCNFTGSLDSNCDLETRDLQANNDWYISTKFIKVPNHFREYICGAAFGQQIFISNGHNQNLLYLSVTVCEIDNPMVNKTYTGSTDQLEYRYPIRYPIMYNQGHVGFQHLEPFYVTGMGLYVDELDRLAVNITTAKPVSKQNCSSEITSFVSSHLNVPVPSL